MVICYIAVGNQHRWPSEREEQHGRRLRGIKQQGAFGKLKLLGIGEWEVWEAREVAKCNAENLALGQRDCALGLVNFILCISVFSKVKWGSD